MLQGYTIRQVSRFYEESVRLDSSFVPGLVGCAVCEEARGNLPKAAEILTRAITVRDNDPALWFRLGQIYLVSGRESEAADCFSKTTTLQSDSIDAWFSWGVALHGLGRLDEATTQFKAALAIDSNHRPAQYRLALIAKQQGNEAKLLTSLLQAVSDVDLTPGAPPMEPPADEAAAHDRYLELVALGNTYIDLNRTLEALPAFQQATQCDSKGVWGWFGVGFCQHRAGSLVEAEAAYNTCLRIEPGFGRAYFNLGVIHEANKDFEEAERCFGRAGKDSSGHGGGSLRHDAAVALAGVFLKRRKTQEAIQQARSVLSAVPAHPRALLLLGMAFERGNQLKHAQEQLQSANDLLMTHGVVDERVVAGLALATVQHHQGEYSSASGYYRRTLDLLQATADSPDRPKEAVNGLGPGLGLDGGGASTLNTYGGIVGMTTARVESLQVITMCNYAACLESMGDRDDAMSLYNEVLKLDSSNATAMKALERAKAEVEADAEASSAYLQAIEQHRKGNFEGAMKHYQAALEKDPENGLAMYGIGVCHVSPATQQHHHPDVLCCLPQLRKAFRSVLATFSRALAVPKQASVYTRLVTDYVQHGLCFLLVCLLSSAPSNSEPPATTSSAPLSIGRATPPFTLLLGRHCTVSASIRTQRPVSVMLLSSTARSLHPTQALVRCSRRRGDTTQLWPAGMQQLT